ncbi:MAG: RNA polymerase sporulation sigma factor SigH [Clostridiales bacterium]|jgi:RNA polymerase sporulation-specific sigma factor|nr:RNA polymerase sporulation sigma factor SigH [Clostridiales bacterium]
MDCDDMEDASELSSEDLIKLSRSGNSDAEDALVTRYKNLVKLKAGAYYIAGADKEDIIQEGMIGLFKAIRRFDPENQASFGTFAELCVNRQIITALKAAQRKKHQPLNTSISLNAIMDTEDAFIESYSDFLKNNPESRFIGQEDKSYIESSLLSALSDMEWRILSLRIEGLSYEEIAAREGKEEKSIDNAIQRVRRKLEKILKRT